MAQHNADARERLRKQLGERGEDFDRVERQFPIYLAYRRAVVPPNANAPQLHISADELLITSHANAPQLHAKNELLVTMVGMRVMYGIRSPISDSTRALLQTGMFVISLGFRSRS